MFNRLSILAVKHLNKWLKQQAELNLWPHVAHSGHFSPQQD